MPFTKPNRKVGRDLKEAAALLTWAGVDLFVVSERMLAAGDEQGALEMQRIAIGLKESEARLAGYADEVKAGKFAWGRIG
ncbi:hypothetical protein F0170_16635 [Pseudomonas sp. MAFF 730085]|uniref:Uncharacterized protein n=1 Tax=Pseudomonas kitaguniensis TaxID=2607908 RepID=A0A5N7JVU2_9PSED|nr:hypothetical protein [Pseudomonas kitaguniensis]MPQ85475.1 hypothetical protein [Pseudomonas kitaguniensis]